jgi:hypothetical protein
MHLPELAAAKEMGNRDGLAAIACKTAVASW